MTDSANGAQKSEPKATDAQKTAATRAFQQLWVAGTMGALFTALARNLPVHMHQAAWPPDAEYTMNIFLRYGFATWLLLYFFASNLRVQSTAKGQPGRKDVFYDVVQSVVALTAVYFLDFLIPSKHPGLVIFAWPSGAILIISGLAIKLFKNDKKQNIRIVGLVAAAGCFAVSFACQRHPMTGMIWLVFLLVVLGLTLWRFFLARIRNLNPA